MKKILCILLILIFAFPLASCGNASEYTYDYISAEYPSSFRTTSGGNAIKGGAYLNISMNQIVGDSIKVGEGGVLMRSLFNEETKTVVPLCFDVTCGHDSDECFGSIYGYSKYWFTGVCEDGVFCLRKTPNEDNQIEAVFYGFDGIIRETIEYAPELLMPNGESMAEHFTEAVYLFFKHGSKIYFSLKSEVGGANSALLEQWELEYMIWFVSFDVETKEWDLINSEPYIVGDDDQMVLFNDAKGGKLAFCCNGVGYVIDEDSGEKETYDCAEILDEMIAKGTLPAGASIGGVYPLRDYFTCVTGTDVNYCKISSREIVDDSEIEGIYFSSGDGFIYDGEQYVIAIDKETHHDIWINVNTGETKEIDIPGKVKRLESETENGLIFFYQELLEDGSLEPETYTVKENGRDVEYWYPYKYFYVTKEDILDGRIDEPWYYDSETYSFVRE